MVQPRNTFAVRVHPGHLRFSSAHFITLDGTCENLHGHNFHVTIDVRGNNNSDGFVVDFVQLTQRAAAVCESLHDRVLLPGKSSEVTLNRRDGFIEVASYGKHFVFPEENCAVLPITNTTAELLAAYIADALAPGLQGNAAKGDVAELDVAVEEADQQWGICRRRIDGRC